jgi:hypothetical protein
MREFRGGSGHWRAGCGDEMKIIHKAAVVDGMVTTLCGKEGFRIFLSHAVTCNACLTLMHAKVKA